MTYRRIGGVDLYAEDIGAGEPVLFLHGGFCSLESMRQQAEALVSHYRVLAFERAGHGRSADIDGEYDYARGVADTVSYLDLEGVDRAHVVGYSDGAIIGLLLALDHPERVRSLVAISANLDPTAFTWSAAPAGIPTLAPLPTRAGEGAGDPEPDLERLHYERLSPDGPEHAEVVLGKLLRLWNSEPHIDSADLARIGAPTLVMSGDRDSIRPDHSLLIAASIPKAQLAIVPGATHGLIAERPDVVGRLIGDFLRQTADGSVASAP